MGMGEVFWLIMILWIIAYFGAWRWPTYVFGWVPGIFLFIELFLLGWRAFGFIIH